MLVFAQIPPTHLSPGAGFGGAAFIAGGVLTLRGLKGHFSSALGNQIAISLLLVIAVPGIVGGVMVGLEQSPEGLWAALLTIGALAVVVLIAIRILQSAYRPLSSWLPFRERKSRSSVSKKDSSPRP